MAANIGLNEGMVRASKTVLNNLLSDHFVLLAKTWNYHWNVKGVSFHSYHVFMEDLYNGLIEDIDAIAERIRSLDERPIGSLAGYLEHNRIKEHCESEPLPEAKQMLAILSHLPQTDRIFSPSTAQFEHNRMIVFKKLLVPFPFHAKRHVIYRRIRIFEHVRITRHIGKLF